MPSRYARARIHSWRPSSAWVRFRTNDPRWFAGGWIIFTGFFPAPGAGTADGKGRRALERGKEYARCGVMRAVAAGV